jgi:hypothetical protein
MHRTTLENIQGICHNPWAPIECKVNKQHLQFKLAIKDLRI